MKAVRVQHRPLEFDCVRLDLVDPSGFERRAHVVHRGPQVKLLQREAQSPPSRRRPAAACGSSLPEDGATAGPTCRPYSTAPSAEPARPPRSRRSASAPAARRAAHDRCRSRAHPQSPGPRRSTEKTNPTVSARALQPSDKGRRAEIGGKRVGVRLVSHSVRPWSLVP